MSNGEEGARLDKFLAGRMTLLSRTKIFSLIKQGAVLVNECFKKPSYHLSDGQKVSVVIKEEQTELKPYAFKVRVIYEDNDIIVIDKPLGLIVHPPQKHYYKTLVNALLYLGKKLSTVDPMRPGVVHRLDKETSGVMVLAKNDYSHGSLVSQFKDREVKKKYRAVIWGNVKEDRLTVNAPLSRDKKDRLKMKISLLGAKDAYTEIKVIRRLEDVTYLGLNPLTGRMHQIRVHLKFLGFPIVGDKKYGVKDGQKELLLHAKELCFRHPREGGFLKFSSPIPDRFRSFLKAYK